ncbi:hypothetical protein GH714_015166 [Hevea brasiliensis]|uniref:Uncharacterized protein n=2 Tax=Hevea brasiliensis TaxID=3981 RepID=A0A6A6KP26_HEVBR|nr:hypothetical protein GH714_015166 [Hevea brasiliensis]
MPGCFFISRSVLALAGQNKKVATQTSEISNMLILSSPPATTSLVSVRHRRFSVNNTRFRRRLKVTSMAKETSEEGNSAVEIAAITGGLVATPVIGWSLYTLKTTGCGLPPGPGGSIGALEGVSYLIVVGIIGWSLYSKAKTGSGLPNGPFGLLGAVEGLSYLSLLAILVVFGLQFLDKGYIPGPVPGDQCFG